MGNGYNPDEFMETFCLDGKYNILSENDFGIANGRITAGINYSNVFSIDGIWAPPYVSSDFALDIRFFGEKVHSTEYLWNPFKVDRKGNIRGIGISSSVVLLPNMRALILSFKLENSINELIQVPVQIYLKGGIDYVHLWGFNRTAGTKPTSCVIKKNRLFKTNNNKAIAIGADIDGITWFCPLDCWETTINIPGKVQREYHIAISMGDKVSSIELCEAIMQNPQNMLLKAHDDFKERVGGLFDRLPAFYSSDTELTKFYNRSLVHYLTNKWEVPEFLLNPCYCTGSIKGGCLASYLWDFSEGWELHPLLDKDALRKHIRHYLKIDITNCYSFDPMSGIAMGPWYPVNQEKIIGLVYYYVKNTGDVNFLYEDVNGKRVLDLVVDNALLGEDLDKPVALIDYGIDGEDHLELRRGYPYNGVLPDLNGRRYVNYIRTYRLTELAQEPLEFLVERADELKQIFKTTLWSKKNRWFYFICNNEKMFRYTIQMFKLIGSPILDDEELKGLLSHLNKDEFLSEYGIHSISKLDPAYDQIDIDNGGGGSCTIFPAQIIERLYKTGHNEEAEGLLKKILWWGGRTPYWGDSFVANKIDYRMDTPLQCTIGGVTGAQCIIFGMFGVNARLNGDIEINPHPPAFSPEIELKGLKIRGYNFDITVKKDKYTVKAGDEFFHSQVGNPVVFRVKGQKFDENF